jgi:hypothetical protein
MKKAIDYIGVSAGAMIFNDKGEVFLSKRSQILSRAQPRSLPVMQLIPAQQLVTQHLLLAVCGLMTTQSERMLKLRIMEILVGWECR